MWARDRCCYVVGREGIEPPQSKTADLQSAELTTCSTYPCAAAGTGRGCGLVVGPSTDGRRWSRRRDSNPEPAVYKTAALPIELRRHDGQGHTADDPFRRRGMIGPRGRMGQAWANGPEPRGCGS